MQFSHSFKKAPPPFFKSWLRACRSIYDIPRYCSVHQYQIEANVDTFDALARTLLFRFMNRCPRSTNVIVLSLLHSCRFVRSKYVARCIDLLVVNGLGEVFLGRSRTSNACKPFFFVSGGVFFSFSMSALAFDTNK